MPGPGQSESQRRLGLEVKLRDVLVLPLECNQRALAMMLLSGREEVEGGTHREETVAEPIKTRFSRERNAKTLSVYMCVCVCVCLNRVRYISRNRWRHVTR